MSSNFVVLKCHQTSVFIRFGAFFYSKKPADSGRVFTRRKLMATNSANPLPSVEMHKKPVLSEYINHRGIG